MSGIPWTDEETEIARQMFAAREPDSEFRRRLGRSKQLAWQRIYRISFPEKSIPACLVDVRVDVPEGAWNDADRRANAPRSLTAWFFKDPPPGYSALDQRQRQVRA
jgi:hypothetical protein